MTFSTPHRARTLGLALALAGLVALPIAAQHEQVDLDAIYRIKQEGFQNSQVMETLSYLTDVYGPLLTNSPNYRKGGDWAVKRMTSWGLTNVTLESWGPFGSGWENERTVILAVAPQKFPILGYSKAWSVGTNGPVTGEVVFAPIETEADLAAWRGKLKGKFVMVSPMRPVDPRFTADARRLTADELDAMSIESDRMPRGGGRRGGGPGAFGGGFAQQRAEFFRTEGVAALIDASRLGDLGTVFVSGVRGRTPETRPTVPEVTFGIEHYGRIFRMLEKNVPVTLELDIKNTFYDADQNTFNVVAEIRGTDKADEVVMIGGHFDSWHTGTGATDNASGSAVMMEVMRILKASGVRLRRTVRVGLWGGEEQGLLGSRAYVTQHFADRQTMQLKPEHAKLSVYFNHDNGSGAIRGVYLQGNEAAAPIFSAWMQPFHNVGMATININDTGGTDHQSFDAVGLPGFQFIQDPLDYNTRTHHSNMDVYERAQAADLRQNAVIIATFVYQAANREQMFPRKPLPQAQPVRTPPTGGGR